MRPAGGRITPALPPAGQRWRGPTAPGRGQRQARTHLRQFLVLVGTPHPATGHHVVLDPSLPLLQVSHRLVQVERPRLELSLRDRGDEPLRRQHTARSAGTDRDKPFPGGVHVLPHRLGLHEQRLRPGSRASAPCRASVATSHCAEYGGTGATLGGPWLWLTTPPRSLGGRTPTWPAGSWHREGVQQTIHLILDAVRDAAEGRRGTHTGPMHLRAWAAYLTRLLPGSLASRATTWLLMGSSATAGRHRNDRAHQSPPPSVSH